MGRVQLRCKACASRVDADLGATEEHTLEVQGYLTRYCNRCRGQSRWTREAGGAGSSFRDVFQSAPVHTPCILVIDDDQSILTILAKALSQADYNVELADSARKAIQLLSRDDYDLILSDIRMPEFDGKQLFEFLDQNQKEYRTKVIFLTGDTGNPDTVKFLEETQCPYFTKPLDLPKLLETLRLRVTPS